MMKTATIIGARGFIGRHLHESLKKSGVNCCAPDKGNEEIYGRDLGTVFYCAGLTNDYKDRLFDTVEAHSCLLNRIVSKASYDRIVYLSSTRLYDGLTSTNEETDLVVNPANPRHIYDLSKALGESICLTSSRDRGYVVRLSSVYSDAPDSTGFVPDLLRHMKEEKKFELDSSSGIVRDYIHIGDVISSMIAIANQDQHRIVNTASGENISNQQIADALNELGYSVTVRNKTERQEIPICEVKKLNSLGIKPVKLIQFLKNYTGDQV